MTILVTERVQELSFDGRSIEDAIKMLQIARNKIPLPYKPSSRIDSEDVPYGRDGERQLILTYKRPENDKERDERLKCAASLMEYRRKQYEALKKEFGNQ